jgi:hypothetical protein
VATEAETLLLGGQYAFFGMVSSGFLKKLICVDVSFVWV